MNREELRNRTKQFAVRIVNLCRALPRTPEARVIRDQMVRSTTSVAANYRAVCRARSKPDFASKLAIVLEEADETLFWLELLVETNTVPVDRMTLLISEANELVCIFGAAENAVRNQIGNPKSQIPNLASPIIHNES